jgi:hypothetical protein
MVSGIAGFSGTRETSATQDQIYYISEHIHAAAKRQKWNRLIKLLLGVLFLFILGALPGKGVTEFVNCRRDNKSD